MIAEIKLKPFLGLTFISCCLWSADPVAMLFPYPQGTIENTYWDGKAGPLSAINPWSNYISIDHIETYDALGKGNNLGIKLFRKHMQHPK